MTRVSDRQLNQVVHIGHLAQECVAERDFAPIMTRELLYLLRACSGVFIEFDPSSRTVDLMSGSSYQVDHSNMKKYLDYYQFLDPALARFKRLTNSHRATCVSTDQVIRSDASYQECEFYQDFLAPTRVHSSIIFDVNIDGRQFGLVGLHRTRRMGPFSDLDHKLSQLVIPYLSIALRFRYSRKQQRKRADIVGNLLRMRGIRGYLILDEHFRLRDAIGEIEHSGLVTSDVEGPLMPGCSVFNRLSEQVRASLLRMGTVRGREAPSDAAVEPRDTGSGQRIEIVTHADGTRHYVLVALDERYSGISESRMQEVSLSPRQTQIVRLLSLGMTNAQISQSLGLQPKTVENYLTIIYQKTSTSNRTELVSILSH